MKNLKVGLCLIYTLRVLTVQEDKLVMMYIVIHVYRDHFFRRLIPLICYARVGWKQLPDASVLICWIISGLYLTMVCYLVKIMTYINYFLHDFCMKYYSTCSIFLFSEGILVFLLGDILTKITLLFESILEVYNFFI